MLVSTISVKAKGDLVGALTWDATRSAPQGLSVLRHTHAHTPNFKERKKKYLVPQKTAALERLAGDAGEDKKLLDIGLTEKMAALPEQAVK